VRIGQPVLWPLSLPYAAASLVRAAAYKSHILPVRRLEAVVISVGNITVGGTGKTPMVLWIAERLAAEGKRTGILTRGYGGDTANSKTSRGNPPGSTSDEVQLMKARVDSRVEFGVGADRFATGRHLVRRGVNWLVLDDGFQHLQLARDVNIVLIDATDPFGGGRVLPAGLLREPRPALSRADIIVITRSDHAPAVEALIQRYSRAPIFYAQTRLEGVRSFYDGQWGGRLAPEEKRPLFAFCGIGNPSAFVADLRRWGFEVVGQRFFPDHHRYTPADEDSVTKAAIAAGATGLVCTEKDVHKLNQLFYRRPHLFSCVISVQIAREEEFWRTIMSVAAKSLHADELNLPFSAG
jgi:tetraacyldisaccharide 4'-kinase